MKKTILFILLVIIPCLVYAQAIEVNGIYYKFHTMISGPDYAEVVKNPNKYSGDIVIPESVIYNNNEYVVKYIAEEAFDNNHDLTSVSIPNSVTKIYNYAFYWCENLSSITMSNSVTSFGDYVFAYCSKLTSLEIPRTLTEIGYHVFDGCTKLEKIYITDLEAWCNIVSQSSIYYADHLYLNNTEIKDLVIPEGVTVIYNNAFYYFTGLTSVTIPSSVTEIKKEAFKGCSGITSLTLNNGLLTIRESAFEGCSGLTSLAIPNSVTTIDSKAFKGCTSLETVVTSNSLIGISRSLFEGCTNLKSITLPCTNMNAISYDAFKNCSALKDFYCYSTSVPSGSEGFFENASTQNAVLHVPLSSIETYKTRWDFFRLVVDLSASPQNLIYMVNGDEYESFQLYEGETITPISEPSQEHYTFSGWSDIPATMPANDVTITGTFSINHHNLIYNVDGEQYKLYDVNYNADITPEPNPTRDGYRFTGWSEIPAKMPDEDVVVNGSFLEGEYTITYKVDGVDYKVQAYNHNAPITPEPAPTKEGYSFSGWSDIPATMPAEDVTITGTFTVCKYNLTYKLDGNVYQTSEVDYGTPLTPIANPSVAAYHTFSGWSEVPATMPAHDVDITGTSIPNKYKLEYKLRDPISGTYSTYKTFEVEYGAAITPEPAPTIEGCTFTGWSTIPATMHSYDVTIYGGLIANYYTLTYQVNGKTLNSLQINYGSTITPLNPTIDGFTFNGWIDLPATMPAHDVTVNASITKNATSSVTYPADWNLTSWSDETASNLESDPKWSKYDNRYLYNTTCPKGESIELSANGTVIKETAGVEFAVSNCTRIYLENRSGSEDRIDIQVYEPADFFFVLKDLKRGQKISIDFSSSDWHTDNDLFPQPVGAVKMTDSPTTRAIRSKSSVAEYVVSNDGNVRFNVNADKFFYLYNINVTAVSDTYLSYLSNPDGINNQIDCYLYWNGYSSSITGSWGGLYARGADVRIENKSNQTMTITRIELYDGTTSLKTVTDQNGNITPGEFKEFTFDVNSTNAMPETLPWMEVYYDVNGVSYIKKFVSDGKGSATGINSHRVDGENGEHDAIYTIDGKKLSSYPTKKGLYIKNGKKFVVK